MSTAFYLDEDSMSRRVVWALRTAGLDVLTTTEAGREGQSDSAQLAFATEQHRVTVTANQRDFAKLASEWSRQGKGHAGIVIVTDQHVTPEILSDKLRRLSGQPWRRWSTEVVYLNANPAQRLE